jgi:hypothetical protein
LDGRGLFYIGLNEKVVVSQVTQKAGANLASDKEFKKMQEFISGYDYGVTYFVTAPVLKYVDRIVESNAKKGTMSSDDKLMYDNVRQYIVPIKSVIFGNAKATAGSVDTQGFMRIE